MKCFGIFLFILIMTFTACVKQQHDAPPDSRGYDPMLPVNATIRQLKLLPQGVLIQDDLTISGIVVMDDKEGNYYKKIALQDSTGGIEVLLDQNNLYNDYPVGRKIYIACKGLYIGAYGQNIQLGYVPDASGNLSEIPYTLMDQYVTKADYPHDIIPDTFTIAALSSPDDARDLLNTLIVIKGVEFSATGLTYAEAASTQSATNRTLQDCAGKQISLRTSGYARFQSQRVAAGNGNLIAVYSRYNNTPQLYIRSPADAALNGARCGAGTAPDTTAPIAVIRSLVSSPADSVLSLAGYIITGIVTSDKGSGNIVTSNIVLQDASAGIVVRFSGTPGFLLGDSLTIDITGGKLSWYNNLLQVSGVPAARAAKLGSGKNITPRKVTINQVLENYSLWESTLVTIPAATVIGGGTFSGSKTLTDGTASMTMFTRSAALFSGEAVPAGSASFTGILGIYGSTQQLLLRNLSDVEE